MKRRFAIFVLLLAGFSAPAVLADIKPVPAKPVTVLAAPIYRFEVQGVKRIFTSPSKVTFQVQYYISPTYANACYIGAYIPDRAHANASFAYHPAGRIPAGVPKGQKWFADNVTFDMKYTGSGSFSSSTIEVVIYNSERILGSSVIHWGQVWKRFDIQGIRRVVTRPEYVKCQVQYFIDPEYASACYIGAFIPNRAHASASFAFHPAGRAPAGVPKGQKWFADDVWFDVAYAAAVPFTSTSIEVVIYDEGRILDSSVISWGQTWSTEVF